MLDEATGTTYTLSGEGVTTIMLDLAFIRNHPDIVKEAARVKYNPIDIDYLLEVDRRVLELQRRVEEARAEQNKISERIRKAGKDRAQRGALIAEGKLLAGQIKVMEPSCTSWKKHAGNCSTSFPISPIPAPPSVKTKTTTYRSGTGARNPPSTSSRSTTTP